MLDILLIILLIVFVVVLIILGLPLKGLFGMNSKIPALKKLNKADHRDI